MAVASGIIVGTCVFLGAIILRAIVISMTSPDGLLVAVVLLKELVIALSREQKMQKRMVETTGVSKGCTIGLAP